MKKKIIKTKNLHETTLFLMKFTKLFTLFAGPKDACQSSASDIVFPIMQHSDCNSPLADMRCPFNNTSMKYVRSDSIFDRVQLKRISGKSKLAENRIPFYYQSLSTKIDFKSEVEKCQFRIIGFENSFKSIFKMFTDWSNTFWRILKNQFSGKLELCLLKSKCIESCFSFFYFLLYT